MPPDIHSINTSPWKNATFPNPPGSFLPPTPPLHLHHLHLHLQQRVPSAPAPSFTHPFSVDCQKVVFRDLEPLTDVSTSIVLTNTSGKKNSCRVLKDQLHPELQCYLQISPDHTPLLSHGMTFSIKLSWLGASQGELTEHEIKDSKMYTIPFETQDGVPFFLPLGYTRKQCVPCWSAVGGDGIPTRPVMEDHWGPSGLPRTPPPLDHDDSSFQHEKNNQGPQSIQYESQFKIELGQGKRGDGDGCSVMTVHFGRGQQKKKMLRHIDISNLGGLDTTMTIEQEGFPAASESHGTASVISSRPSTTASQSQRDSIVPEVTQMTSPKPVKASSGRRPSKTTGTAEPAHITGDHETLHQRRVSKVNSPNLSIQTPLASHPPSEGSLLEAPPSPPPTANPFRLITPTQLTLPGYRTQRLVIQFTPPENPCFFPTHQVFFIRFSHSKKVLKLICEVYPSPPTMLLQPENGKLDFDICQVGECYRDVIVIQNTGEKAETFRISCLGGGVCSGDEEQEQEQGPEPRQEGEQERDPLFNEKKDKEKEGGQGEETHLERTPVTADSNVSKERMSTSSSRPPRFYHYHRRVTKPTTPPGLVDILPQRGCVLPGESFKVWVKWTPTQKGLEQAQETLQEMQHHQQQPHKPSSSHSLNRIFMLLKVEMEAQPPEWLVMTAALTSCDVSISSRSQEKVSQGNDGSEDVLDFGVCTVGEVVPSTFYLKNTSALPQRIQITAKYSHDKEGPLRKQRPFIAPPLQTVSNELELLPFETLPREVVFVPPTAGTFEMLLRLQTLGTKRSQLRCRGVAIESPLVLQHNRVCFPPLAVTASTRSTCISLSCSPSSHSPQDRKQRHERYFFEVSQDVLLLSSIPFAESVKDRRINGRDAIAILRSKESPLRCFPMSGFLSPGQTIPLYLKLQMAPHSPPPCPATTAEDTLLPPPPSTASTANRRQSTGATLEIPGGAGDVTSDGSSSTNVVNSNNPPGTPDISKAALSRKMSVLANRTANSSKHMSKKPNFMESTPEILAATGTSGSVGHGQGGMGSSSGTGVCVGGVGGSVGGVGVSGSGSAGLGEEWRKELVGHVATYSLPIHMYPVEQTILGPPTTRHLEVVVSWVSPDIELLTPKLIDFGKVLIGDRGVTQVQIKNTSSTDSVDLAFNKQLSPIGPFCILNSLRTLQPKQTITLKLEFRPTSEKEIKEVFEIASSSTQVIVKVQGMGVTPSIALEPSDATLSFGDVLVGESALRTMKVHNTCSVPLTVFIRTSDVSQRDPETSLHPIQTQPLSSPQQHEQPNLVYQDPFRTATFGTTNYNGLNPFELSPLKCIIPPGYRQEFTCRFRPDHENDSYFDHPQLLILQTSSTTASSPASLSSTTLSMQGRCTANTLCLTGHAYEPRSTDDQAGVAPSWAVETFLKMDGDPFDEKMSREEREKDKEREKEKEKEQRDKEKEKDKDKEKEKEKEASYQPMALLPLSYLSLYPYLPMKWITLECKGTLIDLVPHHHHPSQQLQQQQQYVIPASAEMGWGVKLEPTEIIVTHLKSSVKLETKKSPTGDFLVERLKPSLASASGPTTSSPVPLLTRIGNTLLKAPEATCQPGYTPYFVLEPTKGTVDVGSSKAIRVSQAYDLVLPRSSISPSHQNKPVVLEEHFKVTLKGGYNVADKHETPDLVRTYLLRVLLICSFPQIQKETK